MIYNYQKEYYQAINQSTVQTDSAPFIDFMLTVILETISASITDQNTPQDSPQVKTLLDVLKASGNKAMSRDELQGALSLKDHKSFRERYLKPALEAGLIEMTLADKPKSPSQCYRLKNRINQ